MKLIGSSAAEKTNYKGNKKIVEYNESVVKRVVFPRLQTPLSNEKFVLNRS